MALKNQYLIDLLQTVKKRNPGEPEFIQAVTTSVGVFCPIAMFSPAEENFKPKLSIILKGEP